MSGAFDQRKNGKELDNIKKFTIFAAESKTLLYVETE